MAKVIKQGGRLDYFYKEVILENEDELNTLSVDDYAVGSVAMYFDSNGKLVVNMLDANKEWKTI